MSLFVSRYLDGLEGVEIGGAAHNDYGLNAINVDITDAMDTKFKLAEGANPRKVDIVAPGDDLPFPDSYYDFVFSSHVLEHFPNPIKALLEWLRVASKYVVCVVPHRERTFDKHERPLTPLHVFQDRHAEGFTSPEDTHWSVWVPETFTLMCEDFDLPLVDLLDPDDQVGNGFIAVFQVPA